MRRSFFSVSWALGIAMHYYKRNIGDYAKKAGKLSMLQHGAYTLLIDACYDRERFPTLEDAIEWAWADTPEQIEAVEFVLRKFFKLQDGVYVQDRITEELSAYRALSEVNSRIAKDREAQKKARKSTEREPFVHESAPNHKPLTTNQEPKNTDQPDGFDLVYQAYPKKVGKPAALRAWKAAKVKPDEVDLILKDIESRKLSRDWQKDDGQYIPNPSTYLNQRRWEDLTSSKIVIGGLIPGAI
jgi:uncharacterized protein YdaU (DUF1376 family)